MPEETEGIAIYKLVERVAGLTIGDGYLQAVQAQCQFANQVYFAIFHMVAQQNGLAAESLLRTLFESAVNCIVLAKHKDKLRDFVRYGQFTHLRLLQFNTLPPPVGDTIQPLQRDTQRDFEQLLAEFKSCEWHKMGTRDSFVDAEYQPEMYDKYYRRASAISHGGPFVVVRRADNTWKKWIVEARPAHWKTYVIGAYVMASFVILHMLTVVSREFKLGLEAEVDELMHEVDALKSKHIDAITQMVVRPKKA